MKTLANRDDLDGVIARMRLLTTGSPRQWGTMSAGQMLCHCIDAFRVGLGEIEVDRVAMPLATSVMKWFVLYAPVKWPKNVPTGKRSDPAAKPTEPGALADDVRALEQMTHRFVLSKKQDAALEHPFFGPLSDREWLRWGYLHLDHHLRQFSV